MTFEAGWNAAIEKAAKWHEDQAETCGFRRDKIRHKKYAAAIRAMLAAHKEG